LRSCAQVAILDRLRRMLCLSEPEDSFLGATGPCAGRSEILGQASVILPAPPTASWLRCAPPWRDALRCLILKDYEHEERQREPKRERDALPHDILHGPHVALECDGCSWISVGWQPRTNVWRDPTNPAYGARTLTRRRRSRGYTNKQIAQELAVTEGTIKVHLHNVYDKLAIRNRTMLALLCVE
jgi:hypothetical protein